MKILLVALVFLVMSCGKGTDGVNGLQGPKGEKGLNGTNGTNGNNGTNGTNGTTVTMVKFCTNYTKTSTFPEYGFCIAGNLYATYWDDKNAWTAFIPPGNYGSTSTTAPCNFKVTDGCNIQDY